MAAKRPREGSPPAGPEAVGAGDSRSRFHYDDGISYQHDPDHDAVLVDFEPPLQRTASATVAEITNTSRDIARRALRDAEGDINLAVITLLSNAADPGLPPVFAFEEGAALPRTVSGDLADFAGIPVALARKHLDECGGDLEKAKQKLVGAILGEADAWEGAAKLPPPLAYTEGPFSCPICLEDGEKGGGLTLQRCGHTFCLVCLKSSIEAQVGDGRAAEVICPMPPSECGKELVQRELRAIMGAEAFAKLDRHALEAAIAIDPTLHHCPTPDCPFITCWAGVHEGPPRCDCPVCKKSSCLQCATIPYHAGKSCAEWAEMRKWMTDAETKAEEMTAEYLRRSNIRTCKRCGAGVVKSSGCNKMKCRCGYRFCYECGSENAQCGHTPAAHGFIDNVTGRGDFTQLRGGKSAT